MNTKFRELLTSILLDNVIQLLNLGVGDIGRLEHIKSSLEEKKILYSSDMNYVEKMIGKYIPCKESQVAEPTVIPNKSTKEQKNSNTKKSGDIIHSSKSSGYKKWKVVLVFSILVGLSILFIYASPAQYFSENLRSLVIYVTSVIGIILEILGFLVFMMIEKKADFGGGCFDGGDVTVNGKPLEENEHIVIRNNKHEKTAIDLVVIGLILQLAGIWYALQKLTLNSNLFSVLNP